MHMHIHIHIHTHIYLYIGIKTIKYVRDKNYDSRFWLVILSQTYFGSVGISRISLAGNRSEIRYAEHIWIMNLKHDKIVFTKVQI
jgi:hypothetical protein